jgi:alpha-L-fucosidase
MSPKVKSDSREITQTSGTLYLHVFNWPADGKLLVPGLKNAARKAWLLAERKRTLATENTADGLVVSVPAMAPDRISSTIVLQIDGAPEIEQKQITQDYDGSVILQAGEARLHGTQIQYEAGSQHDNIGMWTSPDEWADWEIEIAKPGKFDVTAEVAAVEGAGLEIRVADQKTSGNAAGTGDFGRFRVARLGSLEITSPGRVTLSIHAVTEGWHPLNVRSVRLRPARTQ